MGSEGESSRRRLLEVMWLFLRLGTTAFGGPAAHIAMMEDEVVRRRRWVTREEFLDLLGATNLIPGPNSTELAIHLGHRRAGWPGLVVAGTCFILPAMLIVGAIAWAYVRFGSLPEVSGVLYGVKPVVIAVVIQAIVKLARTAVRSAWLGAMAALAVVLVLVGVNELAVLLIAALLAATPAIVRRLPRGTAAVAAAAPLALAAAPAAVPAVGLAPLFLFFAKVGSVLFGSGYVLIAFLRADLVTRWHWLTERQLLDAVAVGQVTPGPVFTTTTFIGYLLSGPRGALVATLGIFLPAFLFVAISGPLVPRMRRSPVAGAVLDGVNVASLALMAVAVVELGRAAIVDLPTLVLAGAAAVALLRFRVGSAWLVLAGALLGLVIRWL